MGADVPTARATAASPRDGTLRALVTSALPPSPLDPATHPGFTVVVPLKAIGTSKTRLAPALSPDDRVLLLRRTFGRVAAAAREATRVVDLVVVVGDEEGAGWAAEEGARLLAEPVDGGLNGALAAADRWLGGRPTIVVPADLPLVTGEDLDAVAALLQARPGVVVAATADGGTGALVRDPGDAMPTCYGPGSARRHVEQARRLGIRVWTTDVPGLALDLDRPGDIDLAGGWAAITSGR